MKSSEHFRFSDGFRGNRSQIQLILEAKFADDPLITPVYSLESWSVTSLYQCWNQLLLGLHITKHQEMPPVLYVIWTYQKGLVQRPQSVPSLSQVCIAISFRIRLLSGQTLAESQQ